MKLRALFENDEHEPLDDNDQFGWPDDAWIIEVPVLFPFSPGRNTEVSSVEIVVDQVRKVVPIENIIGAMSIVVSHTHNEKDVWRDVFIAARMEVTQVKALRQQFTAARVSEFGPTKPEGQIGPTVPGFSRATMVEYDIDSFRPLNRFGIR